MSNYATFLGCASLAMAMRFDLEGELARHCRGGAESANAIPLLWLACFSPGDCVTIDLSWQAEAGEDDLDLRFVSPCVEAVVAVSRLKRRRSGVTALFPARLHPLYNEWIDFVGSFPDCVFLANNDMIGYFASDLDSERALFEEALDAFARADRGLALVDLDALDVLSALSQQLAQLDQKAAVETPDDAARRCRMALAGAGTYISGAPWPPAPSTAETGFFQRRP